MIPPAILCVSANPGMDRRIRLASLAAGDVQRAKQVESFPGGKAAHVAYAAKALGARVVWLGFLGGAIGRECEEGFARLGVNAVRISTAGTTRINYEFIEDSGRITEVLEPGVPPSESEIAQMLDRTKEMLAAELRGAALAISGSLPAGTSPALYQSLVEIGRGAGSMTFVDTSGEGLREVVSARPAFIKANRDEAQALLGKRLRSPRDACEACRKIIELGAESASITLGAEGLVWVEGAGGAAWRARPPKLQAVSTVGCGDATLAGFACGFLRGLSGADLLKYATASGAANCLAAYEGRISPADVDSLVSQIEIERLT